MQYGILGWIFTLLLVSGGPALASGTPSASPPAGPLRGKTVENSTGLSAEAFLGIPFAETTARTNRWQPPIPKAPWTTPLEATQFGPIPPQRGVTSEYIQSEDCLSLNVWRPAGTTSSNKLPVMVWIYGGSYNSGMSSYPLYDGAYLAANKGVVIVSLNYRVGALGFMKIGSMAGNFGLMDQQLGLRWVQANIEHLGGDPTRVTLFGESAGANSIGMHLFSVPSSEGLFRSVIMESNPAGGPPKTRREARLQGALFLRKAGCPDEACLRTKSVAEILNAQDSYQKDYPTIFTGQELPFAPVVDGEFVRGSPTEGFVEGCSPKPMLLGTLANEATLFYGGRPLSYKDYRHNLVEGFLRDAPQVLQQYPGIPHSDNAAIAAQQVTDFLFSCVNLTLATNARAPTFLYQMAHSPSFRVFGGPWCAGKVCHGDDLPFVFNSAEALGHTFTSAEEALSQEVMDAFTHFARTGSPNSRETEPDRWPRFRPRAPRWMVLDTPSKPSAYPLGETCSFWNEIGYPFRPRPFLQRRHVRTLGDVAYDKAALRELPQAVPRKDASS